jgi:hypothetical protein
VDRDGWVEDRLEGYDERREPGLWYVTTEGHLVVGQKADETGKEQHVERYRRVFVRARPAWEAGYVFQARVHLITPYVRGALVLGHTRSDRNVRILFGAGRAPRPEETSQKMVLHSGAWASIEGRRPFDRLHPEGRPQAGIGLEGQQNSFVITVRVNGPTLECWAGREWVGIHTDALGVPLDGAIGFAVEAGAYRVESPVLLALRQRSRSTGRPFPHDHDLELPLQPMDGWLIGFRVKGLDPGPHGAVLFWYPLGHPGGTEATVDGLLQGAEAGFASLAEELARRRHGAAVFVCLPRRWSPAVQARIGEAAKKRLGDRVQVRLHGEGLRPGAPSDPQHWGRECVSVFLDPWGLVRVMSTGEARDGRDGWEQWLRLTRGF